MSLTAEVSFKEGEVADEGPLEASMPSPASRVGDGIRCLATKTYYLDLVISNQLNYLTIF